jgi:hypothetical protein
LYGKYKKEHDIVLDFFAYTQTLVEELASILSPWGFGDELAENRRNLFQKNVFPYIAEWKIKLVMMRSIYPEFSEKYSKNINELLDQFREAVNWLAINNKKDEDGSHEDIKTSNQSANLLYGRDTSYQEKIKMFLKVLEQDLMPLINNPYHAYLKRYF